MPSHAPPRRHAAPALAAGALALLAASETDAYPSGRASADEPGDGGSQPSAPEDDG